MITLITGLPGNGKTLYAIATVKQWSEQDNRPVYYSGIADLNLPWIEIEPEKWFECPKNSIIVIDECQRVFRPRNAAKLTPEHVEKLETHRHLGVDIVLITQHPTLAESNVRRLVGRHLHVVRKFGGEKATIHEWMQVNEACDKPAGKSSSIKHHWSFDKSVYAYYKSAEVHTVKKSVPLRYYFLFAAPVLILAAFVYMYFFVQRQKTKAPDNPPVASAQQSFARQDSTSGSSSKPSYLNAADDAKQYVYERTPREDGLQHTAPRYDELTKPTKVPVPAACIVTRQQGCRCYSQQATPLAVPKDMCLSIVKNGYFEDFDRSVQAARDADIKPAKSELPKPVDADDSKRQVVVMSDATKKSGG